MTKKLRSGILVTDLFWIGVSLFAAYGLRYGVPLSGEVVWGASLQYFPALCAALLVWVILYSTMSLDGLKGGWHLSSALSRVILGVLLFTLILLALAFLAQQYYSRLVLLYFIDLLLVGFTAIRCITHALLHSRYRARSVRRVAILGNGHVARELAASIGRHPEMMWEVVGFLYPSNSETVANGGEGSGSDSSVSTLGVLDVLRAQKVDELVAVMPLAGSPELRKMISGCSKAGIGVNVVPQWYQLYLSRTRFLEIDGLPLISLQECSSETPVRGVQRVMDLVLGTILLAGALPLLVLIAALLYLRKGRAFKKELRCGKGGEPFWMFRLNIDRDDLHLDGLERLLAQLSFTELPQLYNVLKGDMALVGPRPESHERVKNYSDWQRQRLRVRPGLTGLAQVHGLREQHSSEEKARFDMQYIYQWSPFLDLSLILQTVWTLALRLSRGTSQLAVSSQKRLPSRDIPNTEVAGADRTQSCAD